MRDVGVCEPLARDIGVFQFDASDLIPAGTERADHLGAAAGERDEQAARTTNPARWQDQLREVLDEVGWLDGGVWVAMAPARTRSRRLRARRIWIASQKLANREGGAADEAVIPIATGSLACEKEARGSTEIATCGGCRVDAAEHPAGVVRAMLTAAGHAGAVSTLLVEHPNRTVRDAIPNLDRRAMGGPNYGRVVVGSAHRPVLRYDLIGGARLRSCLSGILRANEPALVGVGEQHVRGPTAERLLVEIRLERSRPVVEVVVHGAARVLVLAQTLRRPRRRRLILVADVSDPARIDRDATDTVLLRVASDSAVERDATQHARFPGWLERSAHAVPHLCRVRCGCGDGDVDLRLLRAHTASVRPAIDKGAGAARQVIGPSRGPRALVDGLRDVERFGKTRSVQITATITNLEAAILDRARHPVERACATEREHVRAGAQRSEHRGPNRED